MSSDAHCGIRRLQLLIVVPVVVLDSHWDQPECYVLHVLQIQHLKISALCGLRCPVHKGFTAVARRRLTSSSLAVHAGVWLAKYTSDATCEQLPLDHCKYGTNHQTRQTEMGQGMHHPHAQRWRADVAPVHPKMVGK